MSFINKINDSSAVNSARQFLNTPAKKAVAIVVALAVIVLLGVLLLKGCCCCRKPRPTPPSPRSAVPSNLAASRFGSTTHSTSATDSGSSLNSSTHSTSATTYGFPSSSQPLPADPRFRNSSYVEVQLTPTFTEHVPYSEPHQGQLTPFEPLFSDGFSEFSSTFGFDEFIQPSHSSPDHGEETGLSSIILTRDVLSDPAPQDLTGAVPLLPQHDTSTAESSSSAQHLKMNREWIQKQNRVSVPKGKYVIDEDRLPKTLEEARTLPSKEFDTAERDLKAPQSIEWVALTASIAGQETATLVRQASTSSLVRPPAQPSTSGQPN